MSIEGVAAEPVFEFAPAKVNLSLEVLGRRSDGYHSLSSLVAFATAGDRLSLVRHAPIGLSLDGPGAADAGGGADNLVLRADAALRRRIPNLIHGHFHLVKRLPVAAGLGGGSSDAAAALRLLARAQGIAPDDPILFEAAFEVGADVPVCLNGTTTLMQGIGERLGETLPLPSLPALLVNPMVPVETAAVFRKLGLAASAEHRRARPVPDFAGLSVGGTIAALAAMANDLQSPAIALEPVIADVLAAMAALPQAALVRMSGSGASCFALFELKSEAEAAERLLRERHPGWWIVKTMLGSQPVRGL